MNKPVIYYHLWRSGEWEDITKAIFSEIVSSGLSDQMEAINICINDQNSTENIELHGIPEEKVIFTHVASTGSEWPTLQELYEGYGDIPDTPILYLHSKGCSYTVDNILKQSVKDWVAGLMYYLVIEWRECMNLMRRGARAVGANRRDQPQPHYSGNFWWINSSSLRSLPNPRFQDQTVANRHGAEMWIGGVGQANLVNTGLVGFFYDKLIPRKLYAKPLSYPRSEKNVCVHLDSNLDISFLKNSNIAHDVYVNQYNSYAHAYLTYIVENYDDLPDYTYFIRTSQIVHRCPTLLDIIDQNQTEGFVELSNLKVVSDRTGAPHHGGLQIESAWCEVFESCACPNSFEFGAGALFAVSKDRILSNTCDVYLRMLALIQQTTNPIQDYVYERMWKSVFSDKIHIESEVEFNPQVFIFNYGLIDGAVNLFKQFHDLGVEVHILNSSDGHDELIPEHENIHLFPNVYYSGLWNEALSMFDGSHMMIITSDVMIPDAAKLINNAKSFFRKESNWVYAPNVDYTFWQYYESDMPNYSVNVKVVPNTDGMCWMLSSDAAFSVGSVDIEINKIGFGIDLLACMFATREGKIVGRDYSITVKHPQTRSYDSAAAEEQEFAWIKTLGYIREYMQYRNDYALSFVRM